KTTEIKWSDWTDEAFQRAKEEKKPVLLDISAVWCHWCHRLDKDTYSVPDIVEYIESHFVPIRVDTDKRPDINRRYNMGGWPTTAFLTPDGRLIGGGTYFPPDKMKQILHDVLSYWEKSKEQPTQMQGTQQEITVSEPISAKSSMKYWEKLRTISTQSTADLARNQSFRTPKLTNLRSSNITTP